MSLSDVFDHLDFDKVTNGEDLNGLTIIVTSLYVNSPTARAMLEKLVSDDRYIEFWPVNGGMSSTNVLDGDPTRGRIKFDLTFVQDAAYVSKDGKIVQFENIAAFAHEFAHAIYGSMDDTYYDPITNRWVTMSLGLTDEVDNYRMPDMDLVGDTVRTENEIRVELGLEERSSYPSVRLISDWQSLGFNVGDELTYGTEVDTVIVLKGENIINYAFTSELNTLWSQSRDLIVGSNLKDFISTSDLDDFIYDNGGEDILEGGAGDDEFILSTDGDADIIVVGEGADWIEGGDANDRLVFRSHLAEAQPFSQSNSHPASGSPGATEAIPLLGGFISESFSGGFIAYHHFASQSVVDYEIEHPEGPPTIVYELQSLASPYFGDFVDQDFQGSSYNITGWFGVRYDYLAVGAANNDVAYLNISIGMWQDGVYTDEANVMIYDFEEGDFGIEFEHLYTFNVPDEAGGGTIDYAGDAAHVAYINDNGSYVHVPLPEILW